MLHISVSYTHLDVYKRQPGEALLLPLMMFNFFFYMWNISLGFWDAVVDTVTGRGVKWDKTCLLYTSKQRISIARAIMKDAPIVILDEATANVDPENEKDLMNAVDALTKEKTIIMIAHRLKTVRHADQIVVVDKGRIVQQGTHEQLMKQEGIYKRFVDARQQAVSWKLSH